MDIEPAQQSGTLLGHTRKLRNRRVEFDRLLYDGIAHIDDFSVDQGTATTGRPACKRIEFNDGLEPQYRL